MGDSTGQKGQGRESLVHHSHRASGVLTAGERCPVVVLRCDLTFLPVSVYCFCLEEMRGSKKKPLKEKKKSQKTLPFKVMNVVWRRQS